MNKIILTLCGTFNAQKLYSNLEKLNPFLKRLRNPNFDRTVFFSWKGLNCKFWDRVNNCAECRIHSFLEKKKLRSKAESSVSCLLGEKFV